MTKFKNTENYPKYKINGKTYYKVAVEPYDDSWAGLVNEIWLMKNAVSEDFKLLVRTGRTNTYSLYKGNTNIYRTYSITQIGG